MCNNDKGGDFAGFGLFRGLPMRWCNGRGHPPGCTCAFGPREGGPDGGGGKSKGGIIDRRRERGYSSGNSVPTRLSPMRQMAIEYGMNLTYFVPCKDCRSMVYLFADKNGGFVIFNSLGGRWPIHECYLRFRSRMKLTPMDWWEGHDAP